MAILSNTEFGILRLTISRAQKRNSISAEMFDTMTEALAQAASDDSVRVILLQGGEQIFSAGADLDELRAQPDVLDRAMTNFFAALRTFPKPIVAQVKGPCVGAALSMLLYCDLVYASDRALFSLPSVALGRTTRFGSAFIMAAAAGLPRATEKLMLSEPITAAEALDMRIITGTTDDEALDNLVASKVARLAVLPPNAVRAMKAMLTSPRNKALEGLAEEEEAVWRRQAQSAEAAEALAAFLEGRKPAFRPAE